MQRSVLLGEYEFTLDAKNRVAVPARLRPAFAEGIFLTRGFEKYIAAFPPEEWDRFVAARTGDLPEMSEEGRRMRRFIFGAAVSDELDAQGRVKVPAYLLEFAGVTKDVTIIGVQDHIELWDRAAWARYRKQMEEGADAAADQLSVQ
jgi:transcriptional regulator MraZ